MADRPFEDKVAFLRGVADELRGRANKRQFDFRRKDQLLALAAGFERFADRLGQTDALNRPYTCRALL
jgi:hypothetical protein